MGFSLGIREGVVVSDQRAKFGRGVEVFIE